MKRFKHGVVIGKFYPPHKGHHFLIDSASSQCEKLFVLVCWKPEQNVPVEIRIKAIAEMHPEVTIIEVKDTLDDDDTVGWAAYTIDIIGHRPDAVFTSEDYGDAYAKAMGAQHIMVDRGRKQVPCSGTMVRENPLHHLAYVSPAVRAHYVKRICIVSAESTGKTTLARHLADHYKTLWVPEYGREYCEHKWKDGIMTSDWTSEEFHVIAQEQGQREDLAARSANKVLICDTDPFATSIWHERYVNSCNLTVEQLADKRRYALYILTGDEIPFVQDGLRDGEHIRHWMHTRFIEKLTETKRHWVLVSGTHDERISQAIHHIDTVLTM